MAKILKQDLKDALTTLGIDFDPVATFATLEGLLPAGHALKTAEEDDTEVVQEKVDSELQARWDAFLAKLEADAIKNGTKAIFDAQKAAGEFKTIPRSFTDPLNQQIRPAR